MLTLIREPDAQNVAVGNANIKVLTRKNCHALFLRCLTTAGVELTRAQILNDISDINLKLDGETIWGVDATFLLDRQKYLGDISMGGNVNGIIPMEFTRPLLNSYTERSVSALGLNNVSSVTIDVTVIAVAQLSRIEVYSLVDTEAPRALGQHVRIDRLSRSFAGTGAQEMTDLPFGDDRVIAYLAEHIHHTAGTLDKAKVRRNGVDVFESLPANLNTVLLNRAGRTPQTNYFDIEFDLPNQYLSALSMPDTQSLFHELTWSVQPNGFQVYLERLFKDPKAK